MKRLALSAALALAACTTTEVIVPVAKEAVPASDPSEQASPPLQAEPDVSTDIAQPPPVEAVPDMLAGLIELAPGGYLELPAKPGFAKDSDWFETVVGRYGDHTQAFQASVTAGPDRMKVIMMIPSGPRFLQIDWSARGVTQKRSVFAPDDLSALNILADMYVVSADPDVLAKALQGNWRRHVDGSRDVWHLDDAPAIEINRGWPSLNGHQIIVFTNLVRGYSLEIIREPAS